MTFSSVVIPLFYAIRKISGFESSHFSLMIDDIQDLNEYQIRLVNSWIAYRDNSLFSFKVASSKVGRPPTITGMGGMIIEGHDYLEIDMEGAYQNANSDFGKLAKKIIERRLKYTGINCSAEEYFPVNSEFKKNLQKSQEKAKRRAEELYNNDNKKITDYVYKYARAEYFRELSPKSNIPYSAYTGLESLVHMSTGIIRNLLKPCYMMFDKSKSEGNLSSSPISPTIQAAVVQEISTKLWDEMQQMAIHVPGCSQEMCTALCNLFDKLVIHFRARLVDETASEPRAVKFTISDKKALASNHKSNSSLWLGLWYL